MWNIGGCLALGIDSKMLNPDIGAGQVEVGPVRSFLRCTCLVLIETFVFIVDAIEVEEVGNLALLETLDLLSLQRSDFIAADVVVIRSPGLELVRASIGCKLFPEPGQYGFRDLIVGDQVRDDSFQ